MITERESACSGLIALPFWQRPVILGWCQDKRREGGGKTPRGSGLQLAPRRMRDSGM
ncbi:hypothetical protein ACIBI8_36635 [Streptomyces sp. NPDC050529]|uniref:hypothetical protein n=1 Tax=Streptomyces sp. NPDC050529 TaxID=3365624 RepID=UPI0037B60576